MAPINKNNNTIKLPQFLILIDVPFKYMQWASPTAIANIEFEREGERISQQVELPEHRQEADTTLQTHHSHSQPDSCQHLHGTCIHVYHKGQHTYYSVTSISKSCSGAFCATSCLK